MSFLVLLLVLLLEKFSALRTRIQRDGFWLGCLARREKRVQASESAWLNLALLVLVPAVLLGVLLWLLEPLAHGWLVMPLHVLVVVFALGRGDVHAQVGPLRDALSRDDMQGAWLAAQRDLAVEAGDEGVLAAVQRWLVWQAHQGFFVIIFWYALLGPVPVLVYRLLVLAQVHTQQAEIRERAEMLLHALDWLPARALVATFAFVGNFMAVGRVLLHELLSWDTSAKQLLGDAAALAEPQAGSAQGEAAVSALDDHWQLLVRSAMLWYAVFAFWVLWG